MKSAFNIGAFIICRYLGKKSTFGAVQFQNVYNVEVEAIYCIAHPRKEESLCSGKFVIFA